MALVSNANTLKNKENTTTALSLEQENELKLDVSSIEEDDSSEDGKEKAETESQEKNLQKKEQTTDASGSESAHSPNKIAGTAAESSSPEKPATSTEEDLLHDVGFTITIKPPTGESFEIQVSSLELVQEIHQLLMDREDTSHRTCFSLYLDDVKLDNFAELKTIPGLKEGCVLHIKENPYTVREARIHIRHVRDLLKSLDDVDAYSGTECASLAFLNIVTQGDIVEKKRSVVESVDCTPPDYILPGSKDRPLLPLQPYSKDTRTPQCLKILTTSAWNPPPGPRKLQGDLLYLFLVTAEGYNCHITASPWGFYLNQTTTEEFNPKPATPCYLSHSLVELLNQVSQTFKRNFALLQKKRLLRHPLERVPCPYQVFSWTAPSLVHTVDAIRAEDAFSSKLGYEEHIPGQTRDWNEELQTTRELPRRSLPERLLRERAIFKVHSDFVSAATKGAMAVVDGNVMAINPGEDPKMQMFIWNNIFFSLGFDVRDHYKEVGGDAAAFVAPRNDLQGVRVYSATDTEGLHTLGTVVVDYRGFRITAQSIIPGILEREQEQSVVYGSIDFGKTVETHSKYMDLLQKAGQQLKVLPHKVLNDKGVEVELCSSVECKGIIGNDGRHYILDLLRTFPPDVNFLDLASEIDYPSACKKLGFPIRHQHKLSTLRQELVDAFVDHRYMMFLKYAAIHLQQLTAKTSDPAKLQQLKAIDEEKKTEEEPVVNQLQIKDGETKDNKEIEADEAKKIVENVTESIAAEKQVEENTRDIIKKASAAVGSLKESDFDIRFNSDVFSPGVKHADANSTRFKRERQLVVDAAEFLVSVQLPSMVHDLTDHSSAPTDGPTLCEAMHSRGINVRYLGKLANMLAKIPELSYAHSIAVGEIIFRSVKHILTKYIQGVESITLSTGISHFLNCLLCNSVPRVNTSKTDELLSKKKRKKNVSSMPEWSLLTPRSLWQQIKHECKRYFGYDLLCDSIESAIEKFGLQKISLLRTVCLRCGIQLKLRDYFGRSPDFFSEDDVINLFPIVKHINPRASDALNLYTAGQTKIQQGFLKDGYELISESLNLLNNVYGAMHPEIAQCLRMLARLNYIMGDYTDAMCYQQKAVLMSERVNGIDHPYTITEYTHLALYCYANQQVSVALKLLYRARYLLLLVSGPQHPEVSLVDSNIGLILYAVGQYSLSLNFLENSLALNKIFFGEKSLKVALSYHLVARTQSCLGDFRSALRNEKETFTIYKSELGMNHEKTKESDECLRHLTQQAVVMAKKISEAYNGKPSNQFGLPPIQIQAPARCSVLEMLNVINGILFVHITPAEIDKVKEELEKGASGQALLEKGTHLSEIDVSEKAITEESRKPEQVAPKDGCKVNGVVESSDKENEPPVSIEVR
ncbi:clustered mitochondria protein homolog isoform X2 [Hyalella azteca]|uniref:Clustered mitochondria protein homolog n=1 Tax=Hyalella azteca TaxID=294128 RepID=A0A8B7N348_HYAAZ|nr:clustered mitochondria protein homolog isoform X2 [Hyalella azteca]